MSHWLKNWGQILEQTTENSNRNREIIFDIHLKTALKRNRKEIVLILRNIPNNDSVEDDFCSGRQKHRHWHQLSFSCLHLVESISHPEGEKMSLKTFSYTYPCRNGPLPCCYTVWHSILRLCILSRVLGYRSQPRGEILFPCTHCYLPPCTPRLLLVRGKEIEYS